jgi:hypothetical protein
MAPPRAIPLNMNRRTFLTLSAGAVAFVLAGQRLATAISADGHKAVATRGLVGLSFADLNPDRMCPTYRSGLPVRCCGQVSRTTLEWSWISVSSSLLEGYDEPEILRSSSRQFCLTGAEAGQLHAWPHLVEVETGKGSDAPERRPHGDGPRCGA